MRSVVLARLHDQEHLKALMPLFWATYRAKSAIYLVSQGLQEAGFASEEGMRQGDPIASTGFCVGIHPVVCSLDAELQQVGGFAKFDMDDGYAVGPAEVVFDAVNEFGEAVSRIGLELQANKCQCFSPMTQLASHPARPLQ